ncbi:hypothetical protein ACNSOL_12345 (plasmid) [Aliarcobacter lanthieri]|uniref:hypothetical protein n=1 Tax=Aliarcobacter lanthieri TaxID=1355374 RepID=UPI003AAA946C
MSKYLIALDGYGNSYNSNSYAIIDNIIQELKSIEGINSFNIENWVCSSESVEYDIIKVPQDIKVFIAYQTIENKDVKTKISFKNEIDDETKCLIEKYFKCNKHYKYTFEYLNDIAICDTIEGLKPHILENDFVSKYLCNEEGLKEISNFFNK